MKETKSEFPLYLAKPAQRALASQGIAILNDLSKFTKSEIKELHGIGPNAFKKIQEDMWGNEIHFRKEKWDNSKIQAQSQQGNTLTNNQKFITRAMTFAGTESAPHFDRTAFKVQGKRIFATLDEKNESANIKLSPEEQSQFSQHYPESVAPVSNKWGRQGWTSFNLKVAPEELVKAALEMAHNAVVEPR